MSGAVENRAGSPPLSEARPRPLWSPFSALAHAAAATAHGVSSVASSTASGVSTAASLTVTGISSVSSATVSGVTSAAAATAHGVASAASATGHGAATAATATRGLALATASALAHTPGAVASATLQLPGLLYHSSVGTVHGLVHLADPQRLADVKALRPHPAAFPLGLAAWEGAREQWRAHWNGMLAAAQPAEAFAALLPSEALVLRSEWAHTLLEDAVARMEELMDVVLEVASWSASGSLLRYALEGVVAELGQDSYQSSAPFLHDRLQGFRLLCLATVRRLQQEVLAKEHDHLQAVLKKSGLASYLPKFAVGIAESKVTGFLLGAAAGPYAMAASVGMQASRSLCATSTQSALFHSLAEAAFGVFKELAAHLCAESASDGDGGGGGGGGSGDGSAGGGALRECAVERARLEARHTLQGAAQALTAAAATTAAEAAAAAPGQGRAAAEGVARGP
jgi:hypothetical protein